METQSYDIVFVCDLYVIVSQMNVAVKKSEAVFIREPFSKSIVFTAEQNLFLRQSFRSSDDAATDSTVRLRIMQSICEKNSK